MKTKSVISIGTSMEDTEKVTVAFLVAVGSAETERPTLMFPTEEAVRLVVGGVARGTACEGCPLLEDLVRRYVEAGGRFMVYPICFDAKHLNKDDLLASAELGGTVQKVSYRMAVELEAGPSVIEQVAYSSEQDGRITQKRLPCN